MTACWHIVKSVHGADYAMREGLRRVGYELYYPQRSVMRPVAKRFLSPKQRKSTSPIYKAMHEPMFPTYIFVKFDLSDGRWREIGNVFGYFGFGVDEEGNHRNPVPVDVVLIDGLRALEIDGAIPGDTPIKALPFKPGDAVKIIAEGAFTGLSATIETLDEHGSLRLLMDLMGRKVAISNLRFVDIEKVA